MRCAAARRAGWSGIDKYPGVAIAAPVDGHTVCTPPRILDTTNPSRRGAPSERGSLRYPASVPPSPRTTEPRFRECADKVHDLASLKVSHAPLAGLRRSTTNPEFPFYMPVIINLGKPQTFPQSSSESSLTRICRLSRRLQAVIGWVRAWYGEESQAVIR